MEKQSSQFFQNRDCEFFPCHRGVPEEEFSCLFCYCPLYALGRNCGGGFEYTKDGIKSCMNCTFPHWRMNYGRVLTRYGEIMDVVRRVDEECRPS